MANSQESEEAELARMIAEEEAAEAARAKKDEKAKKAEKQVLVPVRLNRAHWIGEERHDPPEVLELAPKEARRLIEAGVADRMDPLPGE